MWELVGDPFLTLPNWFDEVEVSLSDYAVFYDCLSGPDVVYSEGNCSQFDLDFDEDIDMNDFAIIQQLLIGSTT